MLFSISTLKSLALVISFFFQLATSTPLEKRGPTCKDVIISITASATNVFTPSNVVLDPTHIVAQIIALVYTVNLPATPYDIAARYCEPEVDIPARANTIQLLAHGATYTRNYCKSFSL